MPPPPSRRRPAMPASGAGRRPPRPRSSKRGGRPCPYSHGQVLDEPGPDLGPECFLFRGGAQVHDSASHTTSRPTMPPMDFELSADQVALQDAARDLLDDRAGHDQVRAHLASGAPTTQACGRPWPSRGGWGSPWPRPRAVWAWAGSRPPSCSRRSVGTPRPCPVSAQPAGARPRSPRPSTPSPSGWPAGRQASASVAWLGASTPMRCVAERAGDGWTAVRADRTGRGCRGGRRRRGRRRRTGSSAVDLDAAGRPPAEPAMDVTRILSWLHSTARRPSASGARPWPTGCSTTGRSAPRPRCWAGADRVLEMAVAVRQGPRPVRSADRQLPGGQAPVCRHGGRRRGHALGHLVRGLGDLGRRSRCIELLRRPPRCGARMPPSG